MMRWGVFGGSSRIFKSSLRPAFEQLGHPVVDAPSRHGDDFAPYDEMLARTDIDAVYNPLPNHLHAEWSHRALDAGKHVLCEKPLTLTPKRAPSLFDHAESEGLTILEAYMWPHHPRARKILELAAGTSLGTLQSGRSSFSYPMDMSSGDHRIDARGAGALFDIGIYCIAPFLLLTGRDPVGMAATATRNELGVDTVMSGWIDWGKGPSGESFSSAFDVSFDAPQRKQMWLIGKQRCWSMFRVSTCPVRPAQTSSRSNGATALWRRSNALGQTPTPAWSSTSRRWRPERPTPVFGRTESLRLASILDGLHRLTAR